MTWNDLGGFFVPVNCPADRTSVRTSDKEEKSHSYCILGRLTHFSIQVTKICKIVTCASIAQSERKSVCRLFHL